MLPSAFLFSLVLAKPWVVAFCFFVLRGVNKILVVGCPCGLCASDVHPRQRQVQGKRVASTTLANGKYHPSEQEVTPWRVTSTTDPSERQVPPWREWRVPGKRVASTTLASIKYHPTVGVASTTLASGKSQGDARQVPP